MSARCTLTSPFDHLPIEEKSRVHSTISSELFRELFNESLPRHGSQDRVIAQLLQKFGAALREAGVGGFFEQRNELIAQEILDKVQFIIPNFNNGHLDNLH